MEETLCLQENKMLSDIICNIRDELTNAVREVLLKKAYDTDIHLSFGNIHINAKGSISQISFRGADIIDVDAFVVKQALKIGDDNYFDIRSDIKEQPEEFFYYPIQINGRISFTVLKSSPYFEKKYGIGIHYEGVRVEYASKYLIVFRDNWDKPDVYFVGIFSPEATANTLLQKAGKTLGGKTNIYYCFMNSRPEIFLHLGQVKSDFIAYHPEKNLDFYNFYSGNIIAGIFRINKKTDDNGKVKIRETTKKCYQLIINMQYGSINEFCQRYEIDKILLTAFLAGTGTTVKYLNGNVLTPTRLAELLNLPFQPGADELLDKNLLHKVNYDEIPS